MPTTPTPVDLTFAPVGIAHLTRTNADLIRPAAAGAGCLRVTTAAQLNGTPHIGTVMALLTVFALAAHACEVLTLPATVVFDALDNAPAQQIQIDGEVYTRTVADLIDTGALDPDSRISGFHRVLSWASARSGVPYEVRTYTTYQGLAPVRECLHRIASRLGEFAPIVAPGDGIVRIRPRCPACRLMQKSARSLRISTSSAAVHLDSTCPTHGRYRETVDLGTGTGWYDANTPVRSVQKGFLLAAERTQYDACSVSVDGADWGGAWHAHVLAPALATLGIPTAHWPVSVFTPLILDRSGGKLSKTLYVTYGRPYADLPAGLLDLTALLDHHGGEDVLDGLWAEAQRWAAEPRRLHRAYTVDHIAALLPARPTRADRDRHSA